MQLIDRLHSHAAARPGGIALRQIIPDNGRCLTWEELAHQATTLRDVLTESLSPGAVVMLCSGNRPEFIAAYLAILAAEMTVFPIAPDIAGPELRSAGQRSGAAALLAIGQPDLPVGDIFGKAAPMPACGPDAIVWTNPPWPPRDLTGPNLLLLSSGTTDRPKIVQRSGASIDAVSANMVQAIGFTPADRVLAAVPLCHSYGMEHGLLCPIWAGSCAHLYDRFDLPSAIAELKADAVSIFPGVPFMFETLLAAGDLPGCRLALRRAYSAGGPLPSALFDAFLEKFATPIAQLYGATEIGSVTFNDPSYSDDARFTDVPLGSRDLLASNDPSYSEDASTSAVTRASRPCQRREESDASCLLGSMQELSRQHDQDGRVTMESPDHVTSPRFNPASVGRPMHDVSIQILDPADPDIQRPLPTGVEGHVAIGAPSMLTGYIDGDPPPLLGGYFLTGDLGRLDATGALLITGRIKLLIDIAGRKVNPLEVERVIASHPGVSECVVVPLRVSPTLCRLKAIVTPATGAAPPDVRELRQFAREHLSGYKVPRVFEVRDTLPRSAAGKVLRRVLEEEGG